MVLRHLWKFLEGVDFPIICTLPGEGLVLILFRIKIFQAEGIWETISPRKQVISLHVKGASHIPGGMGHPYLCR
jgi:hypothetical protein